MSANPKFEPLLRFGSLRLQLKLRPRVATRKEYITNKKIKEPVLVTLFRFF